MLWIWKVRDGLAVWRRVWTREVWRRARAEERVPMLIVWEVVEEEWGFEGAWSGGEVSLGEAEVIMVVEVAGGGCG